MSSSNIRGGLLRRASMMASPSSNSLSLIEDLKLQPKGLEFPGYFFQKIKKELSFNQGAFLLLDTEHNFFTPWAKSELDTTTSFRLRLPLDWVKEQNFTAKKIKIYQNELLSTLRPYLSIRTFSMMDQMTIIPFCFNKEILALLCIIDKPVLDDLSSIIETTSEILFKDHENFILKADKPVYKMESDKPMETIVALQKELTDSEQKASAVIFSFEKIIEKMTQSNQYLDQSRIETNILKLLKSMAGANGKSMKISKSRFLFYKRGSNIDVDILLLQVERQIRAQFSDIPQNSLQVDSSNFILPEQYDELLAVF